MLFYFTQKGRRIKCYITISQSIPRMGRNTQRHGYSQMYSDFHSALVKERRNWKDEIQTYM